jgi:hypothetical protein
MPFTLNTNDKSDPNKMVAKEHPASYGEASISSTGSYKIRKPNTKTDREQQPSTFSTFSSKNADSYAWYAVLTILSTTLIPFS